MTKQRAIVSAADLGGGQWQLGSPIPDKAVHNAATGETEWTYKENTRIERMLRVGSYVEVFARYTTAGNAAKAIHQTLMPPTISLVFESAPRAEWEELLAAIAPDAERLDEVLDIAGNTWLMNGTFPGNASTTIIAMIPTGEDTIEVFILPHPGSELDLQGFAIIITLMPLTVQRVTASNLGLQQWMSIMHSAAEAAEEALKEEEEETECPSCSTANEPDATFCKQCGAPLDGEEEEEGVQAGVQAAVPATAFAPPPPAAAFAPPPAAAPLPNGSGSIVDEP
jgi:hypothetical protein